MKVAVVVVCAVQATDQRVAVAVGTALKVKKRTTTNTVATLTLGERKDLGVGFAAGDHA